MAFKIVFTGGGTGGHIFPILAIVREMKKNPSLPQELKLYFLAPGGGEGTELLKKEGVRVKKILSGKWRRYFSLKNLFAPFKLFLGTLQAFFYLFFIAPDIVFSKGGYGSLPVCLAAKMLGVPIILHESDATPGAASRIEAKMAIEVFTSFPETEFLKKDKIICVGNPIRKEIIPEQTPGFLDSSKNLLGLAGEKPAVLILGGSQGAEALNNLVLDILPEALNFFEIIHQTGRKNYENVKKEAQVVLLDNPLKKRYRLFAFLNEQELRAGFAVSEIVVSRAGSGSIFEIAAARKPAILIPLPGSAQNHQLKNALAFKKWGGGEVIEQKNLRPHFFIEMVRHFLERKDILKEMADRSTQFARPQAARIIASYLQEYLKINK